MRDDICSVTVLFDTLSSCEGKYYLTYTSVSLPKYALTGLFKSTSKRQKASLSPQRGHLKTIFSLYWGMLSPLKVTSLSCLAHSWHTQLPQQSLTSITKNRCYKYSLLLKQHMHIGQAYGQLFDLLFCPFYSSDESCYYCWGAAKIVLKIDFLLFVFLEDCSLKDFGENSLFYAKKGFLDDSIYGESIAFVVLPPPPPIFIMVRSIF